MSVLADANGKSEVGPWLSPPSYPGLRTRGGEGGRGSKRLSNGLDPNLGLQKLEHRVYKHSYHSRHPAHLLRVINPFIQGGFVGVNGQGPLDPAEWNMEVSWGAVPSIILSVLPIIQSPVLGAMSDEWTSHGGGGPSVLDTDPPPQLNVGPRPP